MYRSKRQAMTNLIRNPKSEVKIKMENSDYLSHFNPNHDPKTGKFSKSSTLARAAVTGAVSPLSEL